MARFRMAANGPRKFSVLGFTFADRELNIPDDKPDQIRKFINAWNKLPDRYRTKITRVIEQDAQGRIIDSLAVRGPTTSQVSQPDPASTSGKPHSWPGSRLMSENMAEIQKPARGDQSSELGARSSNAAQSQDPPVSSSPPLPGAATQPTTAAVAPSLPAGSDSTPTPAGTPAPSHSNAGQLTEAERAMNRARNPMDRDGDGKSGGSLPHPKVNLSGVKL